MNAEASMRDEGSLHMIECHSLVEKCYYGRNWIICLDKEECSRIGNNYAIW